MIEKAENPKAAAGLGKLPLGLWPAVATAHGCLAMLDGGLKYGYNNMREAGTILASTYIDAAMRHLERYKEGQERDPQGTHNLGHALACIAIILEARAQGNLSDDRPSGGERVIAALDALSAEVPEIRARYPDKRPTHYFIGGPSKSAEPPAGRGDARWDRGAAAGPAPAAEGRTAPPAGAVAPYLLPGSEIRLAHSPISALNADQGFRSWVMLYGTNGAGLVTQFAPWLLGVPVGSRKPVPRWATEWSEVYPHPEAGWCYAEPEARPRGAVVYSFAGRGTVSFGIGVPDWPVLAWRPPSAAEYEAWKSGEIG